MGPEDARRYGFGMKRDAHVAFVAVYLTILLMVAGFGVLRFVQTLPYVQFHWPVTPAAVAQRDHGPLADPAWLGAHRAAYTPIALKLNQQGDVLVQLTVLPDGSIGDAKILKSSGSPQLDASALVSVGYWRYRPAMRNGKPVAANVTVRVVFRLQN
jgi:TonB family protein